MNNKFDELAKGLAQSVTRRQALRSFSVGLAGMALACFGLADTVEAKLTDKFCRKSGDCWKGQVCYSGFCETPCTSTADCPAGQLCWPAPLGSGYVGFCGVFAGP